MLVLCKCGYTGKRKYSDICIGHSKSCGCYNSKVASERMTTHGNSGTRIHNIWKDMRKRCKDKTRKHYGAKGIIVCEEWSEFLPFKEWSMKNGYMDDLSIDRIDGNGNYCPDNCRWVDRSTQNRNTTQNRPFKAISPDGTIYYHNVQVEFAEIHSLKSYCIKDCIAGRQKTHKGWRFERV